MLHPFSGTQEASPSPSPAALSAPRASSPISAILGRLLMDTVEIKGSNVPLLRQVLDSGLKLTTRDLGGVLESSLPSYANPRPLFRTTYLDGDLRISRDQDGKCFVYRRVSAATEPTDHSAAFSDLRHRRPDPGHDECPTLNIFRLGCPWEHSSRLSVWYPTGIAWPLLPCSSRCCVRVTCVVHRLAWRPKHQQTETPRRTARWRFRTRPADTTADRPYEGIYSEGAVDSALKTSATGERVVYGAREKNLCVLYGCHHGCRFVAVRAEARPSHRPRYVTPGPH